MKAVPVDVYDKEGNMLKIDFNDGNGDFIVQAFWDDSDPQTSENRIKFREWAYHMVRQMGYVVLK